MNDKFHLPLTWACYLMYGDETGLDIHEIEAIDCWCEEILDKGMTLTNVSEEIIFTKYHDADNYWLADDCAEFTFM